MKKIYLEDDLWYIENFLTKAEIDALEPFYNDPKHWYTTMRSPYKNILNKFPETVPVYDEDGILLFPTEKSELVQHIHKMFAAPGGIWDRLEGVLQPGYGPNSAFQTFKYCTDEEIERDRDKNGPPVEHIDFAMNWHYEDGGASGNRVASHSIYLNDDFEGGLVEFKLGHIIKPKPGMLVNIPIGEKYMHRVTKVLGPNNRHTLYGQCWSDTNVPISTRDDC